MRIDWMPSMGVSIAPPWLLSSQRTNTKKVRARPIHADVIAYDAMVYDYIKTHGSVSITELVANMPRTAEKTKSAACRLLERDEIYVVGFIPGATAAARKQRVFAVTKKG